MPRKLRTARIAALCVVASLALAGCVGIPTSGSVKVGPAVHNGGDSSGVDLPLGPPPNASRTELVNDFLQAATSADGDYAIAREFLAAKAARSWDPTKSVLVREKPATPEDIGANTVDYSVSTDASVNALGV
ncbi:MAG TPA: hypothetical protein VIJ11_08175, partial [Galbitalea sp.]